jgi:hypothetical protein
MSTPTRLENLSIFFNKLGTGGVEIYQNNLPEMLFRSDCNPATLANILDAVKDGYASLGKDPKTLQLDAEVVGVINYLLKNVPKTHSK